jgi:NAD(P)-dependent dehydrogenase (short-subunit alcohol dehydrogenase family)
MSFLLQSLNPPLLDWRGRVAWLVGASTGIGAATALALHAKGARVIVSARGQAALAQLCQDRERLLPLALDVTDADSLKRASAQIQESYGVIDLVVYCAGHYKAMTTAQFDMAEHKRHLAVNYEGALHTLSAVLPILRTQGHGHLSLVSSVAGFRGLPQSLAYGPTKAALTHLAEVLYLELHAQGIGVSVIHPGFVQTPLTAQNEFAMPALISPEKAAEEIVAGWAKGEFDIHFPKRFTRWMHLLRLLPPRICFAAVRRVTQHT